MISEFLGIAHTTFKALKRGETVWLITAVRSKKLETLLVIKESVGGEEEVI